MNQKKKDYLKAQIGFHMKDLLPDYQVQLKAYVKNKTKTEEWICAALGKKPLSDWNANGLGLLFRADFVQEVNEYIKVIDEMDDDEFDQMFEVKHSDQFEPEKKEVVVIPYRPKVREEKKARTRKEKISAEIDAFFEDMEK